MEERMGGRGKRDRKLHGECTHTYIEVAGARCEVERTLAKKISDSAVHLARGGEDSYTVLLLALHGPVHGGPACSGVARARVCRCQHMGSESRHGSACKGVQIR